MILNTLVCVFLLGMVVLWATYGFFSSFLNLLVTLTSALLAFALWEPVSHALLGMGWVSAWGFGLMVPYVVIFIALRLAMLAVARKNLGFHPVVDQVGGGAMGLAAGIITSGVLVIGAGMMANDKDLLGVQRYRLNGDGTIAEDKKEGSALWVPVDRLTGNLVELLSAGGFRPSGDRNLATAFPKLAEGVEKRRLAVDPMATRTAAPGNGIQVTNVYELDCAPEALEWVMRRSAAYAVMKKDAVDEIWKGEDRKQVEVRLADKVADEVTKGDLEKTLFDGKYLGNADRMGVRGLLGRDVHEAPESVLRRMWAYAEDQIPGGAGEGRAGQPAGPTQKIFVKCDAGKKLVVVDTAWDKEKSQAYDDGVLRLSPHQIQLAAAAGKGVAGARYQPIAWSTAMLATPSGYARRELNELADGRVGIYGTLSQPGVQDRIAFIFAVPKGTELDAVEVRGLYYPLGKGKTRAAVPGSAAGAELAQVIGHLLPPGDPEAKPADLSGKVAVEEAPQEVKAPLGTLAFTGRFPMVLDWTNPDEQNSKYIQEKRDVVLISGEFERERGKGMGSTVFRMARLKVDPGTRCARLTLTRDQCQTLWGAMLDSTERGGQELVMRTDGRQVGAAGFLLERANGILVVRIDPNGKFKVMGKTLAALRPQMGEGDKLHAYYYMDESESLVGYGLYDPETKKNNDKQQYDLSVPVVLKRIPFPR